MAHRICILHSSGMSTDDPFVEGLRRIFDANPALKPAAISTKAGLDNSTIRKLISGANSSPKIDTANRIAEAMGFTLADVIAVGAHEDPSVALDWLHLLEVVTPDVRREAIQYALYLQAKNLRSASALLGHTTPDQDTGDGQTVSERVAILDRYSSDELAAAAERRNNLLHGSDPKLKSKSKAS